jgi:hypothetical protein
MFKVTYFMHLVRNCNGELEDAGHLSKSGDIPFQPANGLQIEFEGMDGLSFTMTAVTWSESERCFWVNIVQSNPEGKSVLRSGSGIVELALKNGWRDWK